MLLPQGTEAAQPRRPHPRPPHAREPSESDEADQEEQGIDGKDRVPGGAPTIQPEEGSARTTATPARISAVTHLETVRCSPSVSCLRPLPSFIRRVSTRTLDILTVSGLGGAIPPA